LLGTEQVVITEHQNLRDQSPVNVVNDVIIQNKPLELAQEASSQSAKR
jgi:membrane fusion protein (multidrug efflux system)